MPVQPFVSLRAREDLRASLCVPQGHTGFAVGLDGRKILECGTHDIRPLSPTTVFLVRVGALHVLELTPLGNSILRDDAGRWQPLQVLGHLEYSVANAERLMDALERNAILEASEFEQELRHLVLDRVNSFLECDSWRIETLSDSIECATSELYVHIEEALGHLGIQLQSFELSTSIGAPGTPLSPRGLA